MAGIGNRRAGMITFSVDGTIYDAKGAFTYNLGHPKRDAIVGSDGIHGYKATPQVAYIEGAITDRRDITLDKLVQLDEVTVQLNLDNGKTIVLSNAWYCSEGTVSSEEGEIAVRFESRLQGQEIA